MNAKSSPPELLAKWLRREKLDAWIVLISDPYLSEYVAKRWEVLHYLSGFSGSAGQALVLARPNKNLDGALGKVFSDSRYHLQMRAQVSKNLQTQPIEQGGAISCALKLLKKGRIGYNPMTVSAFVLEQWEKYLNENQDSKDSKAGAWELVATEDPFDQIWQSRPAYRDSELRLHALKYAGESCKQKIDRVAVEIKKHKAQSYLVCASDCVSWLLNARADDIDYLTVLQGYALVHSNGKAELFVEKSRVASQLEKSWEGSVSVAKPSSLLKRLKQLTRLKKVILYDKQLTPAAFAKAISQTKAASQTLGKAVSDPILNMKAVKNPAELAGMRLAVKRDSQAFGKTLAWLDGQIGKTVLETQVEDYIQSCRKQHKAYIKDSFAAICASAGNAALPHYRSDPDKKTKLKHEAVFLLDSGGQYIDGTTDMTRTVWFGKKPPPQDLREHYTATLKGLIAVSTLCFPEGTSGTQIDAFSRTALWNLGADYKHGCGHGVGAALNVHEAPVSISPRANNKFAAGHVVTVEPGFYLENKYGIRLENIVVATKAAKKGFLKFETISFCPFDKRLIETKMLSKSESKWLSNYHELCKKQA